MWVGYRKFIPKVAVRNTLTQNYRIKWGRGSVAILTQRNKTQTETITKTLIKPCKFWNTQKNEFGTFFVQPRDLSTFIILYDCVRFVKQYGFHKGF